MARKSSIGGKARSSSSTRRSLVISRTKPTGSTLSALLTASSRLSRVTRLPSCIVHTRGVPSRLTPWLRSGTSASMVRKRLLFRASWIRSIWALPAMSISTDRHTTFPWQPSPSTSGGGSGISSGMLNAVPSGKTPLAFFSANLPCSNSPLSISSVRNPQVKVSTLRKRASIKCSKKRSCCWKCCGSINMPSTQATRCLGNMSFIHFVVSHYAE
ncbi:Uncharacterised protein [Acinetobacter baumannii]|nr:Uncharacterised protein [Acinetobacter baumannii]